MQRLLRYRLVLAAFVLGMTLQRSTADDWPQWRGPNRDGVWGEKGLPETFPEKGLPVLWRVPAGNGFSSPIVAEGRVFLIDVVHLTKPQVEERIRCFDERSGKPLWQHLSPLTYPARAFEPGNLGGPNATPIVLDGKLYTLGRRGDLRCFDAANGKIIWERNLEKEFQVKEFLGTPSPLIEGKHLILDIGGKPASLMAFDKETGKDVWKALDETQMCSSPIVVEAGGKRQVVVWTQASVSSVDPVTGVPLWRERFLSGGLIGISTAVAYQNRLLVAGLMLKLDPQKGDATVLWPKSRAVNRRILSNTSTAALQGDHVYSARSSGELVCLDAETGEQVWETNKVTAPGRGSSINITLNGASALLFNDRGELIRARLTPQGYTELARTQLIKASYVFEGRNVAWTYPAYANGCVFARNTEELVCASLRAVK